MCVDDTPSFQLHCLFRFLMFLHYWQQLSICMSVLSNHHALSLYVFFINIPQNMTKQSNHIIFIKSLHITYTHTVTYSSILITHCKHILIVCFYHYFIKVMFVSSTSCLFHQVLPFLAGIYLIGTVMLMNLLWSMCIFHHNTYLFISAYLGYFSFWFTEEKYGVYIQRSHNFISRILSPIEIILNKIYSLLKICLC